AVSAPSSSDQCFPCAPCLKGPPPIYLMELCCAGRNSKSDHLVEYPPPRGEFPLLPITLPRTLEAARSMPVDARTVFICSYPKTHRAGVHGYVRRPSFTILRCPWTSEGRLAFKGHDVSVHVSAVSRWPPTRLATRSGLCSRLACKYFGSKLQP
ncbi:unnamed protein product, partial [Prorocentrum cordatum]